MSIGTTDANDSRVMLRVDRWDVTGLRITQDTIGVVLKDGTVISHPLSLYPSLVRATPEQRDAWEMIGPNRGFEWEALDVHLSIQGLVLGLPERVPKPPR